MLIGKNMNHSLSSRILVVDDDEEVRGLLVGLLNRHGFLALDVACGSEMKNVLKKHKFDLVLLDIMLGQENGFTLCRKIKQDYNIPVIFVSAIGDPVDKVLGLELGADDYITKPFYSKEVIARIKVIIRRKADISKVETNLKCAYIFSQWKLFPKKHKLYSPSNIEISLSANEYKLLVIFLNNPNRVLSREQLLNHLHNNDYLYDN
jgi:two-component system OmpR family response regulator